MDAALQSKDHRLLPNGTLARVFGIDEAAQRVMIACCVRKGSFLYDRNLGVDLCGLNREEPGFERTLGMRLSEAAFSVPDTAVSVLYIDDTQTPPKAVVQVSRKGEKKQIEVILDGVL